MSKSAKSSRSWFVYFKVILAILLLNAAYHLFQNPIHLLSFVAHPFHKTPQETWAAYSHHFEKHGDSKVTPELLAALAQAESSGNPLAAPPWQLRMSTDLAEIYAPASTAFGLMQITKGTFQTMLQIAREEGRPAPVMTRLSVGDQIQLSAMNIRRNLQELVGDRFHSFEARRITNLSSVIHLCGPEVGRRLVRAGFKVDRLPKCGSHWPEIYTRKVWDLRLQFERMKESRLASR